MVAQPGRHPLRRTPEGPAAGPNQRPRHTGAILPDICVTQGPRFVLCSAQQQGTVKGGSQWVTQGHSFSFSLFLVAHGAAAAPFSYACSDCPQLIPADGVTSGTTISTISVPDSGTINALEVFIDATHAFAGDLLIFLAHDGAEVLLLDPPDGNDAFVPVTISGALLDPFVGMNLSGDWTLTIIDELAGC